MHLFSRQTENQPRRAPQPSPLALIVLFPVHFQSWISRFPMHLQHRHTQWRSRRRVRMRRVLADPASRPERLPSAGTTASTSPAAPPPELAAVLEYNIFAPAARAVIVETLNRNTRRITARVAGMTATSQTRRQGGLSRACTITLRV